MKFIFYLENLSSGFGVKDLKALKGFFEIIWDKQLEESIG